MGRRARVAAVSALIAGCGGHPSPPRQPQPERARLVVVGDSLAAGRFADTQAQAFPQRVAAAARLRLEAVGVPGATSAQLGGLTLPGGGKVAVVEAGTNDFLYQTPRKQFTSDYRALLATVTAASPGAKLVCLTVWVPKGTAGKIPAAFYDATIRKACSAGAVADISAIADDPAAHGPAGRATFLGPGDEFHPNSTGHAAIARAIVGRL